MRNVACSLSNILSTLESKAIGHESFTASNLPDPCSGTYKWFAASWCCSYPVPSSSPPPQAQATWVLSNVSQSCDSACGSVGKTCDIKSITSVIGSSNAFSLIASGGGRCTSNQGWSYDSGPGICTDPSCCGGSCIGACTNGGTSTVSCSLSSGSYKRLCACSGSVPPPPPPPSPWAPAYDVSKMVAISDPCSSMKFSSNLRTAGWIFCVQLVGSAIKPGTVTWADTGSWELNLPLSCVDMSKVTVLKANTTGPWGLPTHFVQGEVGMQGMDGTMYLAKGFKFYVTLNTPGIPCNAAMGQNQFSSIMGSFPSRNSLPFTLASAYAGTGPIGFGIVTLRQPSPLPVLPSKAWPLTRSYLSLVYDEQVAKDIIWSPPPSPPNPAGQDFDYDLQAIPGFSFSVSTPIGSFSTKNDIQWRATIDTGADGLRSRVDPSNPHRQLNSSYIIACSASDSGCNPAEVYLYNANVSVTFSGLTKSGQVRSTSYNFGATDPRTGWNTDAPNAVQLADWVDPGWPVTFNWPINRMNLGNTIYLQCPVVYWNYTSMRGGVAPCLPG